MLRARADKKDKIGEQEDMPSREMLPTCFGRQNTRIRHWWNMRLISNSIPIVSTHSMAQPAQLK